jgi:hypothetical protein
MIMIESKTKERVIFIQHKRIEILLLDFSYCGVSEAIGIIHDGKKIIRSQPEDSVLTLTDVTGARYNLEVIEKLKDFTKGNKAYVKASAVVGLDGLKKIVYNAVVRFSRRNLSVFDDIQKAKDWLVEQ